MLRGWHEVARTNFLGRAADGHVVLVEHDAVLVHEADLLLVVAGQVGVAGAVGSLARAATDHAGVNIATEQTEDIVSRDGRGREGCGGRRGGRRRSRAHCGQERRAIC